MEPVTMKSVMVDAINHATVTNAHVAGTNTTADALTSPNGSEVSSANAAEMGNTAPDPSTAKPANMRNAGAAKPANMRDAGAA